MKSLDNKRDNIININNDNNIRSCDCFIVYFVYGKEVENPLLSCIIIQTEKMLR